MKRLREQMMVQPSRWTISLMFMYGMNERCIEELRRRAELEERMHRA